VQKHALHHALWQMSCMFCDNKKKSHEMFIDTKLGLFFLLMIVEIHWKMLTSFSCLGVKEQSSQV